jgi:metastasis-associated protein MTA
MNRNLEYQIGDYVYIEKDPTQPFLIRKIEDLQKVSNEIGTICKVTCFYRRRDIPEHLLNLADKVDSIRTTSKQCLISRNYANDDAKLEAPENGIEDKGDAPMIEQTNERRHHGLPRGADKLSPEDFHRLQQHELFMSRQYETLPAKNIRGRCAVVFLSDIDTPEMYLKREDTFFYSLIYDRTNETLMSDKRALQIGVNFQAVIDEPTEIVLKKLAEEQRKRMAPADDVEDKVQEEPESKKVTLAAPRPINNVPILPNGREKLIYHPHHNLEDYEIDQYLLLSKAVGTFARAFDGATVTKIPTLHIAAAAASRDTSHLHAMSLLHHSGYNIGKASQYLVPPVKQDSVHIPAPILCRDELEHWSPAEAHIFAEALEKCNKDFYEIRQNYLPWKSQKDIIEYYYMYKTSDRYAQARKPKKEAIHRGHLKHIFILPYTKPSPTLIPELSSANGFDSVVSAIACESCNGNESVNWYKWGPINQNMIICQTCWTNWKKCGGLKRPHDYERFHLEEIPVAKSISDTSSNQAQAANPTPSSSAFNGQNAPFLHSFPSFFTPNILEILRNSTSDKTARKTFYLRTTVLQKLGRKLAPRKIFNPRKSSRNPFKELNGKAIMDNLFDRDPVEMVHLVRRNFGSINISPSFIELVAKHCRPSYTSSKH